MANWKLNGASIAAIISSLLTLGCCLPLPFLGAAGIAGVSVFFAGARPWFLGLSAVLIAAGFWQLYRGMRCRLRQSRTTIVLLVMATVALVALLLFPQAIASLLANIGQ